jgi:hypothetical protein
MGATTVPGPLPFTSTCLSWAVVLLCVLAGLILLCSLQAGDKSPVYTQSVGRLS